MIKFEVEGTVMKDALRSAAKAADTNGLKGVVLSGVCMVVDAGLMKVRFSATDRYIVIGTTFTPERFDTSNEDRVEVVLKPEFVNLLSKAIVKGTTYVRVEDDQIEVILADGNSLYSKDMSVEAAYAYPKLTALFGELDLEPSKTLVWDAKTWGTIIEAAKLAKVRFITMPAPVMGKPLFVAATDPGPVMFHALIMMRRLDAENTALKDARALLDEQLFPKGP